MLLLDVSNPHSFEIDLAIEPIVMKTLSVLAMPDDCEMSIVFINDEEISDYYRHYFGYTKSTDVLSFPSGDVNPENGYIHLGDILISYPFVKNQAESLSNDISAEIALMIIHGTLHLLGFDHADDSQKKEMWTIQGEILKQLDIQITKLPE